MKFDIITIFPRIFDSYFNESILARAQKNKLIEIKTHNLRDYTEDKHKKVDDTPYGGGAGMVLMADPIIKAVDNISKTNPTSLKLRGARKTKIVLFSAKGKQFNQKMAYDWSKKFDQIILIAGRYEGIDERVVKALKAEEVSVGPYVLTDGEVPAMAVVSAVSRLVPGVIKLDSLAEESHWSQLIKREGTGKKEEKGSGLEYPHYTRPEVLEYKGKKYRVPKVLLSGDHKKIEEWRKAQVK
ncbi:MAG: tRNA (guanosine(37)-N1)-methyltransferase TrmD [bacterium]|nr:tRNA (guanosine(37)-N1)-methyltransferase TrmD [bacterium]